jgi:ubiquinol-cytochrome c reductase cytochrome b subunit
MYVLSAAVIAYAALIVLGRFTARAKITAVVIAVLLLIGFFSVDAKVWGVALMGGAVLIFFLLPWLDVSPVKSIRYKGALFRIALGIFVVVFLVLGYFGTQPVTQFGTMMSQFCTLLYFSFFLLMPWYSRMDRTTPVPARVTP